MAHTITVELSEQTYMKLQRAAELSEQPLDTIVEQSLVHNLSPLLDDIPQAYQADVYPLLHMNEAALRAEAAQQFPPQSWEDYEALLDKKKRRQLSPTEQQRLEVLRRKADAVTFRKAYAAVLLNR